MSDESNVQQESAPTVIHESKVAAHQSGIRVKKRGFSSISPFVNDTLTKYFTAGFNGVNFEDVG